MPRKKRTRAGKPKMPKPKEADDLSDVSMCSMTSEAPLSKEEIVAQIVYQFQCGVENKIKHLRTMMHKAITDQKNLLKMELLKIPKDIRKMKVTDFLKAGGDMDTLILNEADSVENATVSFESTTSASSMPQTTGPARRTATARKTRATKPQIVAHTEGRVTRGAKTRAKAAIGMDANDFVTPARGILDMPIITPKIAPTNSNVMSVVRNPRIGELTYSLAGSPVTTLPKNDSLMKHVSGAIMDMSPTSLQMQAEDWKKIKDLVESKFQTVENKDGKGKTSQKSKGKSK
eukprot:Seg1881.1 transcript_id=Seg1881.1/GoldUCD/mRNA.D3Y31 product="hypothetical protein" protein_id=Seg1881.1/GoldUCD/D3Y31